MTNPQQFLRTNGVGSFVSIQGRITIDSSGEMRRKLPKKGDSIRKTGALVYVVVDDDPCARDGVADLIRSAGLNDLALAVPLSILQPTNCHQKPSRRMCEASSVWKYHANSLGASTTSKRYG
jgi:hypothetical protein